MINALLVLFGFQLLGTLIEHYFVLPIPGPVLGMALLLGILSLRSQLIESMKPTTDTLIKYLPVLFVPAAAGIVTFDHLLNIDGVLLVLVLVVSTLIGIVSTAWIFCVLAKRWAPADEQERAS